MKKMLWALIIISLLSTGVCLSDDNYYEKYKKEKSSHEKLKKEYKKLNSKYKKLKNQNEDASIKRYFPETDKCYDLL